MNIAPVLALLVMLGGTLLVVPRSASAGPQPTSVMHVALDADSYVANFQGNGPAILVIGGLASLDRMPGDTGVVTARAQIDSGWRLLVSPSTMVLDANPQRITITVIVPQGTPQNLSATLRLFCMYRVSTIASDSAVITVGPCPRLRLETPTPIITTARGETARFDVWVQNAGNGNDTVRFAVLNYRELSDRRWHLTYSCCTTQRLGPGRMEKIHITARPGVEEYHNMDRLWNATVTIRSEYAGERGDIVSESFQIILYVKPSWIPVILPMVVILFACVGAAGAARMVQEVIARRRRRAALIKGIEENE